MDCIDNSIVICYNRPIMYGTIECPRRDSHISYEIVDGLSIKEYQEKRMLAVKNALESDLFTMRINGNGDWTNAILAILFGNEGKVLIPPNVINALRSANLLSTTIVIDRPQVLRDTRGFIDILEVVDLESRKFKILGRAVQYLVELPNERPKDYQKIPKPVITVQYDMHGVPDFTQWKLSLTDTDYISKYPGTHLPFNPDDFCNHCG